MNNFTFYNPTKIFFGKNAINNLEDALKEYVNILVVYGGKSIKQNGIYDEVISILNNANKNVLELSGVMPNPRVDKVYEGIEICKENNIEFILAVGGGSVIDCSKSISLGSKTDKDVWDFYIGKKEIPSDCLPIGTILTLAATGTEMNPNSVITNWETNEKLCAGSPMLYPKFSILDPTYTYTVPQDQLIYGSIDILAHIFEQYFGLPDEPNISDNISEAIMKTVIENLEIVLTDSTNYDARANLMWSSTMALNRIIGAGKAQDWNSHMIEHALSGIYDIAHGAGLSIIFPAYMKYIYKKALVKFKRFAVNIWNIATTGKTDEEIALEGIEKTKQYFSLLGAPVSLSEASISPEDIEKIAELTVLGGGSYIKLQYEDVVEILKLAR